MKKLIPFILILIILQLSKSAFSQVTIKEKDAPFATVIKSIEDQTGYTFFYDEAKIKLGNISLDLKNASIDEALNKCFKNTAITYKIVQKTIVLSPKNELTLADTTGKKFNITGKITNEQGEEVPGATVFVANSKNMTASDVNGVFHLNQLNPGDYEIVVKALGFNTYSQNLDIKDKSVNINIELSQSVTALNEVNITSKPTYNDVFNFKSTAYSEPEWGKYFKLFIKNFIGESDNADECEILNPEIIKLRYDSKKDVLEARTNDFLIIKNEALGYQMKYLLNSFVFDSKSRIYAHQGYVYFEELKGSADQQKQWQYNREMAYEGSIRHFFRSLYNQTTTEEGFFVYRQRADKLGMIVPVNPNSVFVVTDDNFKSLKLTREAGLDTSKLFIVYTRECEAGTFYNSDGHIELPVKLPFAKNQVSQVNLNTDIISFDKNGTFKTASKVLFNGYWSWKRVADLLPYDYVSLPNELETDSQKDVSLKLNSSSLNNF